ncbi:hypothetical protein BD410DRAFT_902176 [Rickenella mellea]|uniref:Uncharacterized protein n=1 Tax=Rickenella mellea TaxID=50990 RepID=A0A4Y7PMC1_9AGAM|nr:hypothetical protein BD410DRAFT_902176 [Rickenella mellea]
MRDTESEKLLDVLWTWRPPKLTLAAEQRMPSGSGSTRYPEFYNQHLAPELVLKFVKHLPGIGKVIKGQVDSRVEKALAMEKGTLLLPKSTEAMDGKARLIPRKMYKEESVVEFYKIVVFYTCAPIASTLLLHPGTDRWATILELMRQNGPAPIAYANLRIRDHTGDAPDVSPALWNLDPPAFRELLQHLIDDEVLIDWCASISEFKLPSVGAEEMMAEIDRNARLNIDRRMESVAFPWEFCPYNKKKAKCINRDITTEIGDDVLPSVWNVLIQELSEPQSSNVGHAEAAVSGSSEIRWSQESPVLEHPTYKASREVTAKYFCDQAWVQAVFHDASLILMSTGNYEFIGIRDRKTQTLYISDLIIPSEYDAYLKLHTGFYITAIEDMLARVNSFLDRPLGTGGGEEEGGNDDHGSGDRRGGVGGMGGGGGGGDSVGRKRSTGEVLKGSPEKRPRHSATDLNG